LVVAIDITLTIIPILKIVYEEFKELRKIKQSVVKLELDK
jgi:hypothetical protein